MTRNATNRLRCGSAVLLAAALAAGCATTRPAASAAFDPPPVLGSAALSPGTALTGPLLSVDGIDPDPARALSVRGRIDVVERLETSGFEPLGARARVVLSPSGATPDPLRGVAEETAGVLVAEGGAARALAAGVADGACGRTVPSGTVSAALPAGSTLEIAADLVPGTEDRGEEPGARPIRRVALLLARAGGAAAPDDRIEVSVFLARIWPSRAADPHDVSDPGPLEHSRTLVLTGLSLPAGGDPVVIAVPRPFGPHRGAHAVATVFASTAPERGPEASEHAAALERGLERAAAAARSESERSSGLADVARRSRRLREAAASLADPAIRRSALLFLADGNGAALAADAALACDETTLADLAAAVGAELSSQESAADAEAGFRIERAAYRLVASRVDRADPDPALSSVLARHAGDAARFPASLFEIAESSRDADDMASRIAEENVARLDDPSVEVRVAAYEWVSARGLVPAAYDPLAPRAVRRAALERAENARRKPEAGGP